MIKFSEWLMLENFNQPMYIGTGSDFGTEFKLGVRNPNVDKPGVNKFGFFFTSDPSIAQYYARDGGTVKTVKLHVSNPLVLNLKEDYATGEEMNALLKQHRIEFEFDPNEDQEVWRFIDDGGIKLRNAIKKAGYDGLAFPDSLGYKQFTTYVVFDPKQIELTQSF